MNLTKVVEEPLYCVGSVSSVAKSFWSISKEENTPDGRSYSMVRFLTLTSDIRMFEGSAGRVLKYSALGEDLLLVRALRKVRISIE